ncbi:MAG: Trk system potassium transporter TrkA, partial [Synergistales bacterium]|nr:Trk system potassium transporter TrkA [Synergistales bacterium]
EIVIDKSSPVSGKKLRDIGLPPGVLVALISREGELHVPFGDTQILPGDTVLLFASSKILPKAVEILGVQ